MTGVLLAVILTAQMSLKRYVATVYWLAVVLVSVVGTLVSDNLADNLGAPLEVSTVFFAVLLAVVFTAWYASEEPCRSTPSTPVDVRRSTGWRSW